MWKWLRSWFAWRFSLGRLVIATLFLGVVVGLNMQKVGPKFVDGSWPAYYWGWPFPIIWEWDRHEFYTNALGIAEDHWRTTEFTEAEAAAINEAGAGLVAARRYQEPLTHRAYCLLELFSPSLTLFVLFAVLDTLFTLTVLALILFLQIPRRGEQSPFRAGG
jgi:hypothetical protein